MSLVLIRWWLEAEARRHIDRARNRPLVMEVTPELAAAVQRAVDGDRSQHIRRP